MKKNSKCFFAIITIILMFTGCSNKKSGEIPVQTPTPTAIKTPEPTPEPTPIPLPTEDLATRAKNIFTGNFIDKEVANRRPVSIVINNIEKALPQSGISQADIIYEVLAEGDITRLVAIFRDFKSEKIGPVRSARDYFLNFAFDNDAIFVHHGGSPGAYSALQSFSVSNLDGMRENTTFWRDKARVNSPGMYEHSSYTNYERIMESIERRNYRNEIIEDFPEPFDFYDIPASPANAGYADKITIPFSQRYVSSFEYDEETYTYKKFNQKGPHIDEETGEQLEFSNIIVQSVSMNVIAGDDAGRRSIKTVGSGKATLFTNGTYIKITWEKTSEKEPTKWRDENGHQVLLNNGKTYIAVFDSSSEIEFSSNSEIDDAIEVDNNTKTDTNEE